MTNRPPSKPAYDFAAEYSGKAAAYARDWAPVLLRLTRPLLDALPLAAARRILDIGTGSGGHVPALQAAAPNATLFGIDIALGMLQEARRHTGARYALMEANRLALRAESFDVALSTFILQHVPDPERVFRETLRTLTPGGAIGLASWGVKDNMPASAIWVEELDREGADEDPRPDENHRELVDAPDKVEQLLRAAGYASIRSWAEIGHVPWRRDDLMSSQATVCSPSRRLRTLSPTQQAACAGRVRRRVDALSNGELTYRPEVILSVARRPA